jgi:glycosyltransferase 2 family protein
VTIRGSSDPTGRLLTGLAALALSGVAVRDDRIGRREAAVFRLINRLPDRIYPGAWLVMQLGTLGAGPAAAVVAAVAGRPRLARRLALGGVGTWASSKVVKRIYRRPRPGSFIGDFRCRGPEQTGLGYVSGHAGVAVALAAAVLPELGSAARVATLFVAPTVGLSRIYVGAHLPLDVVGGAALGLAVDALWERVLP